jgi:hypothetical protein
MSSEYVSGAQSMLSAQSASLAGANLDPGASNASGDHFAHASGKVCKTCHRPIEDNQPARRRGDTEWSHDVCPAVGI